MFNFAGNVISNLDSQISTISNQIAELERQLAVLRDNQKALENERQAMLTLAQAGESALQQAFNFLKLADMAGRDDMTQAFWQSMDSLRDRDTELMLPETAQADEPQPKQPAPTNPNTPDVFDSWESADKAINAMEPNKVIDPSEGVIDTSAETVPQPETDTEQTTQANEPSDSPAPDTDKPEWHDLKWQDFVKYAAAKGIATKGRKRGEIESDLLALTRS